MLNPKPELASLQIGRAVASILVVVFHVTVYVDLHLGYVFLGKIFLFGYAGVDFFFVLSGFVITYAYADSLGQAEKTRAYFLRRVARIYPLLWVLSLIKLASFWALPSLANENKQQLFAIVGSFTLFPLPTPEVYTIIGSAWTLTHEMLFYLIFGLGIRWGRRWLVGALTLWAAAIIVFYGSSVVWHDLLTTVPYLLKFLLLDRNLGFGLGVLAAFACRAYQHHRPLAKGTPPLWAWGALGGGGLWFSAAGVWVAQTGITTDNLVWLFSLPSVGIIFGSAILEIHLRSTPNATSGWVNWLGRGAVFLGEASYSIYLAHFMLVDLIFLSLKFLGLSATLFFWGTTLLLLSGAIGGGCLLYWFGERPLTNLVRTWLLK